MKHIFLIVITFFLLKGEEAFAQCNQGDVTTFQKTFGGPGNERGHSVQNTPDGGFIVAGETTSYGAGGKDWFVMKLDANGVEQWTKTYGSTLIEDGNSIAIIQTSDGGYLFVGHSGTSSQSTWDAYAYKLDANGNILWGKRVDGNLQDAYRDVIELASGDYILAGQVKSNSTNGDILITKVSSLGNTIWSKLYIAPALDQLASIMEFPNGDLLIGGHSWSFGFGNNDQLFIRTDDSGNLLWSKYYGGSAVDAYFSTDLLSDGSIIAMGMTGSFGAGNTDLIMSKFDVNGNVLWSKTFGGSGADVGSHVEENQNNEIVFSGHSSNSGGNSNLILGATDLNGNLLWLKKYGGSGNESGDLWANTMDLTQDNGVVIVGGTFSFSSGGEDIYLVKTNECGNSFCNDQDANLTVNSYNIQQANASITVNNFNSYSSVTSIVTNMSFSSNVLCLDTLAETCNLTSNFSQINTCLGDSTFFTDLSIDSITTIINWKWYFGDGDSLVGIKNPAHLYSNSGTYNVTLAVLNDSNCIDSITQQLIINPIFSINQTQSICQGDSLFLNGAYQTVAGNYVDSLQTIFGCDSIVITNLLVNQRYLVNQNTTICSNDSIFLAGAFQNTSGIYTDSLQTIDGCDSIIRTDLVVNPFFNSLIDIYICEGDSVLFGNNYYLLPGVYIDTFQTYLGCDSLLTLNLNVRQSYLQNFNQVICEGDSLELSGIFQTTQGVYVDSLSSVFGCDSIVYTFLDVFPNFSVIDTVEICQGDSVFLGGGYQYSFGDYQDTLQSFMGCDSLVYSSLIIKSNPNIIAYMDTIIEKGNVVQLNVTGGTSYSWTPSFNLDCSNCQNPLASPDQSTEYIVFGETNGCYSSDTIFITVNIELMNLYIPNAFVPGSSGDNAIFYFYGSGISEFEVQIFDRWGELLYESNDMGQGWNGVYQGRIVPVGVYTYKVRVVSLENVYRRKIGRINVIR